MMECMSSQRPLRFAYFLLSKLKVISQVSVRLAVSAKSS
jgi:hypothetical protein